MSGVGTRCHMISRQRVLQTNARATGEVSPVAPAKLRDTVAHVGRVTRYLTTTVQLIALLPAL